MLAAAGLLAVGSNFSPLWYTAKHSKETMRGGSELASTAETSESGTGPRLRHGVELRPHGESATCWFPTSWAANRARPSPPDGEVGRRAERTTDCAGAAQQLPAYWGTQPYTGGPTYLGAAAIFLAALGVALVRGRNKWWIVAVSAS